MDLTPRVPGTHARFMPEATVLAGTVIPATVSRARTTNVATIIFASAHNLWSGAILDVTGLGGTGYVGADQVITVVNPTTITFPSVATNETTAADVAGVFTFNASASSINRPSPNDAGWRECGDVEESSDSLEDTTIELFAPKANGGRLQLKDVISLKEKLVCKFTVNDVGPLSMEVAYRTPVLTAASTGVVPLGGSLKKGWLELKRYDHNDLLFQTLYLWVLLKISGDLSMGGSDAMKPQFEAHSLKSSQNLMILVGS